MGEIKGGPNGLVSGKVGNLVYYTVNGKQYVRRMPTKTPKATKGQTANRTRFGAMSNWVSPLTAFVREGFKDPNPQKSGYSCAISYLSANALSNDGDNFRIHPEKMLVSQGTLPGTPSASVALEGQELLFTWDPVIEAAASPFDQVLALAYDPEQRIVNYFTKGYFRKQGSLSLPLSQPGTYHCYLGFVAHDQSDRADSRYLGSITIS